MLPYGHHWIDEDDIKAVCDVLRSDFITQGSKVSEFEEKVAAYCDTKYAVAVSSGTAGLQLACKVAGVGKGDEVITTPLTFVASASSIIHCGGIPVFADINPDTFNIDIKEMKRQWTPNKKFILPVDFAGHPVDLDQIMIFARNRGLIVIEDACHALGAEYKGERIGSIADMTVFSLHPVKHITTAEGGLVLTNNEVYYQKLKTLRHHGIIKQNPSSWYYEIPQIGYNFRLTDVQCALGISQLKKLDGFVARRRDIVNKYNETFKKISEITIPYESPDVKHAYHIYIIQLCSELVTKRDSIIDDLRHNNIGATVHYTPLHLQPYFQHKFGYKHGDYPKTETYYERAITLPLFAKMTNEDVNYVIESVKKVIRKYV